ncbi:MAG: DCC1-like thiol-disulfide oxidoreductase family protein [Flavobacteriales bacterium]|nr:DCC1-like thiol-disulfide oxidoreductase family protein [Flavobacteriales bacterium]
MSELGIDQPIIFFDGVCNVCNRFIDFLLRIDKHDRMKMASLQGDTAKQLLSQSEIEKFDSIILKYNNRIYYRSEAVLQTLNCIGGFWKFPMILYLIPGFIRNPIYMWIAKNRHKWFGKRETCRMPTASERNKMLP